MTDLHGNIYSYVKKENLDNDFIFEYEPKANEDEFLKNEIMKYKI